MAYIIYVPKIESASFTVNPVDMNSPTKLIVSVVDQQVILEPYFYYAGDLYSGEADA